MCVAECFDCAMRGFDYCGCCVGDVEMRSLRGGSFGLGWVR
jgi:hypothetical protein